jgi:hypothetical protein
MRGRLGHRDAEDEYEAERRHMVRAQTEHPPGDRTPVRDERVLRAMRRHAFIPLKSRQMARRCPSAPDRPFRSRISSH